jgi:hypothetical protein
MPVHLFTDGIEARESERAGLAISGHAGFEDLRGSRHVRIELADGRFRSG